MIHLPPPPDLVDALGNPLRAEHFEGTFSNAPYELPALTLEDLRRATAHVRRRFVDPYAYRLPPPRFAEPRCSFLIKQVAEEASG